MRSEAGPGSLPRQTKNRRLVHPSSYDCPSPTADVISCPLLMIAWGWGNKEWVRKGQLRSTYP